MAIIEQIKYCMRQALREERAVVQLQRKELLKLSCAYKRYVDIEVEIKSRRDRIEVLTAILNGEIANIPLWHLIAEFLAVVEQARVYDLRTSIGVTRQAIESALRSHKEVFRVIKNGRHKFISLKSNPSR